MHRDYIFQLKSPFQIFLCKWSCNMCCVLCLQYLGGITLKKTCIFSKPKPKKRGNTDRSQGDLFLDALMALASPPVLGKTVIPISTRGLTHSTCYNSICRKRFEKSFLAEIQSLCIVTIVDISPSYIFTMQLQTGLSQL